MGVLAKEPPKKKQKVCKETLPMTVRRYPPYSAIYSPVSWEIRQLYRSRKAAHMEKKDFNLGPAGIRKIISDLIWPFIVLSRRTWPLARVWMGRGSNYMRRHSESAEDPRRTVGYIQETMDKGYQTKIQYEDVPTNDPTEGMTEVIFVTKYISSRDRT